MVQNTLWVQQMQSLTVPLPPSKPQRQTPLQHPSYLPAARAGGTSAWAAHHGPGMCLQHGACAVPLGDPPRGDPSCLKPDSCFQRNAQRRGQNQTIHSDFSGQGGALRSQRRFCIILSSKVQTCSGIQTPTCFQSRLGSLQR